MIYFQNIRGLLARLGAGTIGTSRGVFRSISRSSMLLAWVLIIVVILVGTLSYNYFEQWTFLESLYATIITLTTVGYGDLSPTTTGGRVFSIFFTLAAIGIAGYAISTVAAFVIEREERRSRRLSLKRRMKQINDLENHIILCGGGYIGKRTAREFYNHDVPFVILEPDEDKLRWTLLYLHDDYVSRKKRQFLDLMYDEHDTSEFEAMDVADLAEELGVLYIQEDATVDRTLIRAGIQRAHGLVVANDDDKTNLFVVLGARQLARRLNNTGLRIVTRVVDEESFGKLQAAGADRVLLPNVLGGMQLASHMINPEVAAFWDHVLSNDEELVRVFDLQLKDFPELAGQTVADLGKQHDLTVIVIKREGRYLRGSDLETALEAEDVLIVLGDPHIRARAKAN